MSELSAGDRPAATIPLRDGGELRVDAEGMHVGDTRYGLEQIQDARQVSPDPETIGLRVQGVGLVSLAPARAGDAAVALDVLYRLRPELRPAGWTPPQSASTPAGPPLEQPTSQAGQGQPATAPPQGQPSPTVPQGQPVPPLPPGYPPLPYGAPPGYAPPPGSWPLAYGPPPGYAPPPGYGPPPPGYPPPSYFPPPGYAPPPGYPTTPNAGPPLFPGYAVVPGSQPRRGGLGPWPQGIGDVLGTTFRLYFESFWRFLLLGLAVATWPGLLGGLLIVGELSYFGIDPRKGLFQILTDLLNGLPASGQNPASAPTSPFSVPTPTPAFFAILIAGELVYTIVVLVLGAWEAAAFGIAARESIAGRPVRVGAALGEGLRRLPAALGALLLLVAIFLGVTLAWGAIITALGAAFGIAIASGGGSSSGPDAGLGLTAICGVLFGELLFFVVILYLGVRLGMAPFIAGADRLSPGRALGRSWSLTRHNWWRTFVPLLVIYLVVYFLSGILVTPLMFLSLAAMALVSLPLESAIAGPLFSLALMVIYYDLRLRQEGFAPLAAQLGLAGFAPPAAGTGATGVPGSGDASAQTPSPPDGPAQPDHPPSG